MKTSTFGSTASFTLLACLSSVVAMVVVGVRLPFVGEIRPYLVHIILGLILLFTILPIALGLASPLRIDDTYSLILVLCSIGVPTAVAVLGGVYEVSNVWFWIALFEWNIIIIIAVFDYVDGWSCALLSLSAMITITYIFCRIGELGPVRYAINPLARMDAVRWF